MSQLPLTYPDLVCGEDLDPFGAETTSDLQSLIQDLYHVLIELPGSNPDDPDAGVGVFQYLSGTSDAFAGLAQTIENQFTRDDRVESATCSIAADSGGLPRISVTVGVSGAVVPLQFGFVDGNFTNLT